MHIIYEFGSSSRSFHMQKETNIETPDHLLCKMLNNNAEYKCIHEL